MRYLVEFRLHGDKPKPRLGRLDDTLFRLLETDEDDSSDEECILDVKSRRKC